MRAALVTAGILAASPALAQLSSSTVVGPTISLPAGTGLSDAISVASSPATTFYRDLPGAHPSVVRLGDRVTVGALANAFPLTQSSTNAQQGWPGTLFDLGYLERDANVLVGSSSGGFGVTSVVRASDYKIAGVPGRAYGYGCVAQADTASGVGGAGVGECAYWEAHLTNSAGSSILGEMVIENNANADITYNPYVVGAPGTTTGWDLECGGGTPAGGNKAAAITAGTLAIYHCNTAYLVSPGSSTWNNGIMFQQSGLTRNVYGLALAEVLATGHQMQWDYDYTGTPSGYIRSVGTAAGLGLIFDNTGLAVHGAADSNGASGAVLATFTASGGLNLNGTAQANVFQGNGLIVNGANVYGAAGVTGLLSVGSTTATGYPTIDIDGVAGSQRQTTISTGGALRWAFGAGTGAEGGSNAGSDFFVGAFGDTGAFLGNYLSLTRATGQVSIAGALTVGGAGTFPTGLTTATLAVTRSHTPTASTEACTAGQMAWDTNFIYVCVSANSWKRTALSSW